VAPFKCLELPRPFVRGGSVPDDLLHLDLSGDIHHYARHQVADNYASVVAGGGAFLHPSHTRHVHPQGASHDAKRWPPTPRVLYPERDDSAKATTERLLNPYTIVRGGLAWLLAGVLSALGGIALFGELTAPATLHDALDKLFGAEAWNALLDGPRLATLLASLAAALIAVLRWPPKQAADDCADALPADIRWRPVTSTLAAIVATALIVLSTPAWPGSWLEAKGLGVATLGSSLCLIAHSMVLVVAVAWAVAHLKLLPAARKRHRIRWLDYLARWSVVALGAASTYHGLRVYGSPPGAFAAAGLVLALLAATAGLAASAWFYAAKFQGTGTKVVLALVALGFGINVLFAPVLLMTYAGWWAACAVAAAWVQAIVASKVVRSKLGLSLSFLLSVAVPLLFIVASAPSGPKSSLVQLPVSQIPHGLAVFVVGAALGAVWLGHYFAFALALGCHNNEAGSAARIDRFCHFIRFRIDASGIVGYVIGVDELVPDCSVTTVKPKLIDSFRLKLPASGE
jgi:hypothetical protein